MKKPDDPLDALLDEAFRQMRTVSPDEQQEVAAALARTRLALREAMQAPPASDRRYRRLRSRAAKLAVAATFVVAFIGLEAWLNVKNGSPSSAYGLAFADVVKKLRSARTMTFTITVPSKVVYRGKTQPGPPHDIKVMCLGTQRRRIEYPHMVLIEDDADGRVLILTPDAKGATLFDRGKWLPLGLSIQSACGGLFQRWGSNSESLGEQTVDGRRAIGFRVTYEQNGTTGEDVVWVDPVTQWVIRVEHSTANNPGSKVVMQGFAFDVPLDLALFSLDPPPGYKLGSVPLRVGNSPARIPARPQEESSE